MEELRLKGNEELKSGNYEAAVQYYTEALNIEKTAAVYSNRSLAHLKLQKYYDADCDAQQAVNLDPMWSKGYFRVGEVRNSIGLFAEALTAYATAQLLYKRSVGFPDAILESRLQQAQINHEKQLKFAKNIPWVCAGVGLILAVILIVADFLVAKKPVINHVLLQSLIVFAFSGIGGAAGKVWMWYEKHLRSTKLQPPLDKESNSFEAQEQNSYTENSSENVTCNSNVRPPHNPRYTKAQARYRFKKGKS